MNRKQTLWMTTLLGFACTVKTLKSAEVANPDTTLTPLELKHTTRAEVMAVSPDGKTLVSASIEPKDNKNRWMVHRWSLEDGQLKKSWESPDLVKSLAFSPDTKTLAVGGKGSITLWNSAGKQQKALKGHTGNVESLEFSPNGKTLASGGTKRLDGNPVSELFLWNLATGTKSELPVETPARTSFMSVAPAVHFSSDGTQIVAPQSHFRVGIWDTATLQLKASVGDETVQGVVTAVALSPDKQVLATGHTGHNLRLWSVPTGRQRAVLLKVKDNWTGNGPSGVMNGLAFQGDGRTLISAGSNQEGAGGEGELMIWNWPDHQMKSSLIPAGQEAIRCFAASTDGKVVAIAGDFDPTIKVWRGLS